MMRRLRFVAVVGLLLGVAALPAQELKRRGTGDIVGNLAEQIREAVNDMMDKFAQTTRSQAMSDAEMKAFMSLAQMEGQLAAMASLSRNDRAQGYAAVLDAVNRSTTDTSQALRGLASASLIMADWTRLQMDLRQLETCVRSTPAGR